MGCAAGHLDDTDPSMHPRKQTNTPPIVVNDGAIVLDHANQEQFTMHVGAQSPRHASTRFCCQYKNDEEPVGPSVLDFVKDLEPWGSK